MRILIANDQRGLGKTVVAAMVVVAAAVIGVVAWQITKSDPYPPNATKEQKVVVDSCNKLYADTAFCKFAGGFNLDKAQFKMDMTNKDSDGKATKLVFKNDGKGNSAFTTTADGTSVDIITLDKVTYMKGTDGVWYKFPQSTGVAESNPTGGLKFDVAKEKKEGNTIKQLGKEACGSLTCYKYQLFEKKNPGMTQYMWFDDHDFMLRRFYSQDKQSGTTEAAVSYEAVSITAPAGAQDYTANPGALVQ